MPAPTAQQTAGSAAPMPDLPTIVQSLTPSITRSNWVYLNMLPPVQGGPTPHLAQGTGRTGRPDSRNTGFVPGGYLARSDYSPSPMDYTPRTRVRFLQRIPKTISQGIDGLAAMNPTYRAHDFTMASYMPEMSRSAANWQVMSFAANSRNLLARQQVAKYNIYNQIATARPLSGSNFFLGYQVNPQVASPYGGSGQIPMGS